MAIEREELDREARRRDREDDPKVRRMADELDTLEKRATKGLYNGPSVGAMPASPAQAYGGGASSGPAPFYGQPPLTAGKAVKAVGAYPADHERYIPPAQRVMMDADQGIMDADAEAWHMQTPEQQQTSYGKLALDNVKWVPEKDRPPNIDDEQTWPSEWKKQAPAPTARFPDEPSWGALTPEQQRQGYQMMAWGNEANLPRSFAAPQTEMAARLEGLAPALRTDEYLRMSNQGAQPPSPALAYGAPSPAVDYVPAWATQSEREAMAAPAARRRFSGFDLNKGIPEVYADYERQVRGGY